MLYAGRLTREKGADLLADAFLAARARDPRLHLCLAGGGPEEDALRERLGEHATFLGWLEGDELARAYASADLFLFASRTDTFGQVAARGAGQRAAGRRGRPRAARARIVEDGVTGLLCPPDAQDARRRGARAGRRAAASASALAARARDGRARAHVGGVDAAARRGLRARRLRQRGRAETEGERAA